ncbi:MAG: hypothetical protein KDK70_16405, partial [Myxococcales bacterium]|nr:hypothetical protein [Myxococcales bacterium]
MKAWFDRHPWAWLGLGVLLLAASQMRFGLGILAWIAPVPWLRHVRITQGWRPRLALAAAWL